MVHRGLRTTTAAALALVSLAEVIGQCGAGSCQLFGQATTTLAWTYLTIRCQSDDVVQLDGYTMVSRGDERTAVWQLESGKWYEVRLRIIRKGVTHDQTLRVRGGDRYVIDLRQLDQPAAPKDTEPPGDQKTLITSGPENFGLDVDKLGGQSEQVSGTLTRDDVLSYVRATDTKARVTVIVPQDAVVRTREELQNLEHQALVQVYPPGHWALRRAQLDFEPETLVIQYPDGKVFAKEPYRGVEQVKSLLAKYGAGTARSGEIPTWVWIVGLILLVMALRRR